MPSGHGAGLGVDFQVLLAHQTAQPTGALLLCTACSRQLRYCAPPL